MKLSITASVEIASYALLQSEVVGLDTEAWQGEMLWPASGRRSHETVM